MQRYRRIIFFFLGAIALLSVFCVYSFLSFTSVSGGVVRLNSPDETANYFFARTYAQSGQIGYDEPLLASSKGVVHPRSMTTAGNRVVPVGFLGLTVLYGLLGKLFGVYAILFLTPFFAVCSAYLLYLLLKRIFSKNIAALSGVLLLIHPAYWYYATRGLLPNVLFVDLLLVGCLCTALGFEKKRTWCALFGGVFVGLALTVRLSEIIWVFAAATLLALVTLRRKTLAGIFLFIIGCALPLGILFSFNKSVYGHPFLCG